MGSAGAAINEMLLQSYEGKIRLFPAIPENWPVAFTLQTEGSFIVSALRQEDGVIPAVGIQSRAGNVWKEKGKKATRRDMKQEGKRKDYDRFNTKKRRPPPSNGLLL